MRQFSPIHYGLKSLASIKIVWLLGITYIYISLYSLLLLTRKGEWSDYGFFDLLANVSGITGSTNGNMFIITGIPMTYILIVLLIERNEHTIYTLKFKSRFQIWHSQVITAFSISLSMTVIIIALSSLISAHLVGTQNTWLLESGTISKIINNHEKFQSILGNITSMRIIVWIFITKFLGFWFITMLVLLLKQLIRSNAVIVILLIALAGLDMTHLIPYPVFTGAASLSLLDWLHPINLVYRCLYLVIISLILYGIGGLLYERKDFLS